MILGPDVQQPMIQVKDLNFVIIDEMKCRVAQGHHYRIGALPGPSLVSLSYLLFTSASTGHPKGVMVEHRGVVRLVKQSNMAAYLP